MKRRGKSRRDFDGPATVELYIDGEIAASLNTRLQNAFPTVRMGADFRTAEGLDYDIYVDDIAMSLERVGCG